MFVAPQITLRGAMPGDWNAIASLLLAHRLPPDGAQAHLSDYIVACHCAEVVGVAGLEVYGDTALLRSFAVAPAAQRQGLGRLLLEDLLTQARRRHITSLYLLTTTAEEYFARWGFQPTARGDAPHALHASAEFQGACPATAVLMSLALSPPAAHRP